MKNNAAPQTITAGQVPPYSYRLQGMSAEAGALSAIKALNIFHPCDALGLLWQLRKVAKNDEKERAEPQGASSEEQTQQRATATASDFDGDISAKREFMEGANRGLAGFYEDSPQREAAKTMAATETNHTSKGNTK